MCLIFDNFNDSLATHPCNQWAFEEIFAGISHRYQSVMYLYIVNKNKTNGKIEEEKKLR